MTYYLSRHLHVGLRSYMYVILSIFLRPDKQPVLYSFRETEELVNCLYIHMYGDKINKLYF